MIAKGWTVVQESDICVNAVSDTRRGAIVSTCAGPGRICGGLPVWAEIRGGKDADTPNGPGEYWSEVQEIYWLKRDGTPGKPIPESLWDRAYKADPGFMDLQEKVYDHIRFEQALEQGNDDHGS